MLLILPPANQSFSRYSLTKMMTTMMMMTVTVIKSNVQLSVNAIAFDKKKKEWTKAASISTKCGCGVEKLFSIWMALLLPAHTHTWHFYCCCHCYCSMFAHFCGCLLVVFEWHIPMFTLYKYTIFIFTIFVAYCVPLKKSEHISKTHIWNVWDMINWIVLFKMSQPSHSSNIYTCLKETSRFLF